MNQQFLKILMDFVNSISPLLWTSTLAYIYAAAWQWTFGAIVTLVLASLFFILAYKSRKGSDAQVAWYIFGTLFSIVFICCTICAIGRFLSPNWYAINLLIEKASWTNR
jgi:hypothetical protein